MVNFLQSVRALVGLILFVVSLLITFDGFPGALLSWFGGGVVTLGYTVAIASITHEDIGNGKQGPGTRFILICIAFAVASFGKAMVMWGNSNIVLFGSVINFVEVGVVLGIICGLFNIDKKWASPRIQPSQKD